MAVKHSSVRAWVIAMAVAASIMFVLGVHAGSRAQVVCGPGQLACGMRCYNPARGEQCFPPGVVCGPGQQACGMRCYHPASGDQCFPPGIVCGPGQQACGMRCYNPARGERCFP
jgi:hypothetical protein